MSQREEDVAQQQLVLLLERKARKKKILENRVDFSPDMKKQTSFLFLSLAGRVVVFVL